MFELTEAVNKPPCVGLVAVTVLSGSECFLLWLKAKLPVEFSPLDL